MKAPNPCVGQCNSLADVCPGCNRTFEEVRDWNTYDEGEKWEVLERIGYERYKD